MNRQSTRTHLPLACLKLALGLILCVGSLCFVAYFAVGMSGWSHTSGAVVLDADQARIVQYEVNGRQFELSGWRILTPGQVLTVYYPSQDPARGRLYSWLLQAFVPALSGCVGLRLFCPAGITIVKELRQRSRDFVCPYDVVNLVLR